MQNSRSAKFLAVIVASISVFACSEDDPMSDLFSSTVEEIAIEIDYQPQAEPFTGSTAKFGDIWGLFAVNAKALFNATPKVIDIPTTLDQMERLADVSGQDFSTEEILSIAKEHRNLIPTEQRQTFYMLFLDGYFLDEGKRQAAVLGVSIGNTGVIAMFKPVINSAATARFVEQTTLIHEFGHAIGLVDNGLAMVSPHLDPDHGAHCNNPDCVMYYLNEGVGDLVDYVKRRVASESDILFDSLCLQDTAAAVH